MLEEDQLALTEWGWKTKARLRADVVLRRSYLFILPPTTWVVQPDLIAPKEEIILALEPYGAMHALDGVFSAFLFAVLRLRRQQAPIQADEASNTGIIFSPGFFPIIPKRACNSPANESNIRTTPLTTLIIHLSPFAHSPILLPSRPANIQVVELLDVMKALRRRLRVATMVNPCLRSQFAIRGMYMSVKARFECDWPLDSRRCLVAPTCANSLQLGFKSLLLFATLLISAPLKAEERGLGPFARSCS
jgi:hypothetical protein